MKDRDYYISTDHVGRYCVFPEKRPRNIWVVYDTEGKRIGEVGANSENEARQHVARQVMIPFRLSQIEE